MNPFNRLGFAVMALNKLGGKMSDEFSLDHHNHKDMQELVEEFHLAFGLPMKDASLDDKELLNLRVELIEEEYKELSNALWDIWDTPYEGCEEAFLKELVDLLYVSYGMAVCYDWEMPIQKGIDICIPSFPFDQDTMNVFFRGVLESVAYFSITEESNRIDLKFALERIITTTHILGSALWLDVDGAFREVHESNMSKLGDDGKPIYRDDGKVLKGPNYKKPDLSPFL